VPSIFRRPAKVDWYVTVGDTASVVINVIDENSDPIDLTGRTITAFVKGVTRV
jgi:hypothetical protein